MATRGQNLVVTKENGEQIHADFTRLRQGVLTLRAIKQQDPDKPAFKKHFMHGLGHPLGLDVHDVGFTTEPILSVEPTTCPPRMLPPHRKLVHAAG